MKTIERIKRVPLREVWKHEAHNFTLWLQDNIDVLEEVVGFEISNAEREQSTGNFSVDIKAENSSGDVVIIENQLEKSDHDHLGKLITYLASFDAKVAIWIVSEPRPEHIEAISWLNQGSNGCDFYLLKIEAIQIDNSAPAPLITKIVGPSEEAKQVGQIKKEDSERDQLRYQFWSELLNRSKGKLPLFSAISPTKDTWIGASAGRQGFQYSFWVTKDNLRVELRIDLGKEQDQQNVFLFNQLLKNKEQIEEKFGQPLEWNEAEGFRVCLIRSWIDKGGYRNSKEEWTQIADLGIEMMKNLETATKSYIPKLKIETS